MTQEQLQRRQVEALEEIVGLLRKIVEPVKGHVLPTAGTSGPSVVSIQEPARSEVQPMTEDDV